MIIRPQFPELNAVLPELTDRAVSILGRDFAGARQQTSWPECRSGRLPFVVSGVDQDATADPARAFPVAVTKEDPA